MARHGESSTSLLGEPSARLARLHLPQTAPGWCGDSSAQGSRCSRRRRRHLGEPPALSVAGGCPSQPGHLCLQSRPVLTAPVSAVPALFATVRARLGPARFVPSKPPPGAPEGGFDGTKRAGTRSAGRKQGRNSADGCGEDRASVYRYCRRKEAPSGGRSGELSHPPPDGSRSAATPPMDLHTKEAAKWGGGEPAGRSAYRERHARQQQEGGANRMLTGCSKHNGVGRR